MSAFVRRRNQESRYLFYLIFKENKSHTKSIRKRDMHMKQVLVPMLGLLILQLYSRSPTSGIVSEHNIDPSAAVPSRF